MADHLREDVKLTVTPDSSDSGEHIGHYRVLRLLGKGGMGAVYEVEHSLLNQKFALKILLAQPEPEQLERFKAEAKVLSSMQHDGLLRIYEFGVSDKGAPYIVTDLFNGRSLSTVIGDEGALEADQISQIMTQIATALGHAHEKGIVHRDIKPSNILIREVEGKPEAKVIDFGLAKKHATAHGEGLPTLTVTGAIVGTPIYMSPEQCQGHRLDGRTDVYSLGCVLYEMLTGFPPFNDDNFMAVMFAHVQQEPKPIPTQDKVRSSLAAVAMRCLAKNPDHRYQSMQELQQDLDAISSGGTVKQRKRAGSFKKRLRFYIPVAIAASVMAFAAAAYELWAPQAVLYMHIPIMDRNHAEALVAMREANRLRLEGRNSNGQIDAQKYKLAETILEPVAAGEQQWNKDAALNLAALYAAEGKYADMDRVVNDKSKGDALTRAQNLHAVGVALDQSDLHTQAWPVMNQSHDLFLKLLGDKHPSTVKELFNMCCADSDGGGNDQRTAQELRQVIPNLHVLNKPELEDWARQRLQELENQKVDAP